MVRKELSRIFELSVVQRILLVEEIWNSIAQFPESVPLTDADKEELDRRLSAYHADPKAGTPWNELKKKLIAAT